MKKILAILFLMMAGAGWAQSNTALYNNLFEEGNVAYNERNFERALALYDSIADAGMESAALFYNMGNTYYKMKDYPHAILYYEKALKLDPGDEDIRVNLEMANAAVVDKINEIPQSLVSRWWNGLRLSLSVDGWAWLSIVFFALLLICLFMFLMSRRTSMRKVGFYFGLVFVVCLSLSVTFAVVSLRHGLNRHEAIVMTPTVNVKSSPSNESVDLFVLHEGAKVRILDRTKDANEKDWNKIKLADGSVGYLPAGDMTEF